MRFRASAVALALVVLTGVPAAASPPANDDLAGAAGFTLGDEIVGVNDEATEEASEPLAPYCWSGTSEIGNTLWYRFTAPNNTFVSIGRDEGELPVVSVLYEGTTFADLTPMACAAGILQTAVSGGRTYFLQIGGSGGQTGRFRLATSLHPLPQDDDHLADDLAAAGTVRSPYLAQRVELLDATTEAFEDPLCGGPWYPAGTMWLKMIAPADGMMVLDGTYGVITNVYRGTAAGDLAPVGCETADDQYDYGGMRFPVLAGETYALQFLDSVWDLNPFFVFLHGPYGRPANDDLAAATNIAGLPFSDEVVMWGASDEPDEPASACTTIEGGQAAARPEGWSVRVPQSGIWYRYAADEIRSVAVDVRGSDFNDIEVEVFMVEGEDLISVACGLSLLVAGTSGTTFTSLSDREYLIRISGARWLSRDSTEDLTLGTLRVTISGS